jgi:hypothetical protein
MGGVKMASPDPISSPQSTINELIDHPTVGNVREIIGSLRISRAESESESILFTTRCKWVVRHTARNDELQRKLINTVICTITGAQEARRGQIDEVQRLVYTKGDTILVAATGYRKLQEKGSAIHVYCHYGAPDHSKFPFIAPWKFTG